MPNTVKKTLKRKGYKTRHNLLKAGENRQQTIPKIFPELCLKWAIKHIVTVFYLDR